MYLREKLDELKVLEQKVKELRADATNLDSVTDTDEVLKELLVCVDSVQNIKLLLQKVNSKTLITIGQSQIDISTAVIIRDTIKTKIRTISSLISSNTELDLLNLMKQRDVFIEEYNSINKAIRLADWSVNLD